jgi:hypothetical protein
MCGSGLVPSFGPSNLARPDIKNKEVKKKMVIRQERWLSVQMLVLAVATLGALLLAGAAGYELRASGSGQPQVVAPASVSNPAQYHGGSAFGKNPG